MTYELDVRPAVASFALAMEAKLRKHDPDRGAVGWREGTPQGLLRDLYAHTDKLEAAVRGGHPAAVLSAAADVGNFAMMVTDLLGGLSEGPDRGLGGELADAVAWFDSVSPDFPSYRLANRVADEALELVGEQGGVDGSRHRAALEAADVLILLAAWARREGVDLATAVRDKLLINRRRRWDARTMRHVSEGTPGEKEEGNDGGGV